MKHIKPFENFNEGIISKFTNYIKNRDIKNICDRYVIENYTINSDGTIDVDGNVDLSSRGLTEFPLKFRNVSGNFDCRHNRLITLEGSPQSIGGFFDCYNNKLTSLKGGPISVGGAFYCYSNELENLEGSPKEVGGSFDCRFNGLKTLEGIPLSVGGDFICYGNPVFVIWDLFRLKYIENKSLSYRSMVDLFNDYDIIRDSEIVILDRLNAFLQDIGKPTVTKVEGYKCI